MREYKAKLDISKDKNNKDLDYYISDANTSDFYVKITKAGKSVDMTDWECMVLASSPSGLTCMQYGVITYQDDVCQVYIDLESYMKNEVGKWTCQLVFEKDDEILVLDTITYVVTTDLMLRVDEAVSQDERIPILRDLIVTCNGIISEEALRVLAEQLRVQAEEQRVANEHNRVSEELQRQANEVIREQNAADLQSKFTSIEENEVSRQTAEQARQANESIRQANEEQRVTNEVERVTNEQRRDELEQSVRSNEQQRINAETQRQSNEQQRTIQEDNRQTNENIRQTNEALRQTDEANRQNAEVTRQSSEVVRQSKEDERQQNEAIRQSNEQAREDRVQELGREVTDALEDMSIYDATLNQHTEIINNHEQRITSNTQYTRTHEILISALYNDLLEDRITTTQEGNVVSLPYSKNGIMEIEGLQGNTLVNYCTDGGTEQTLNDEIDIQGTYVTLTEGVDSAVVDILLEGNTLVNVGDQKESVAITKSYTVGNTNHVPLQGEYDGKCRPVVEGNTVVNYCTDGDKAQSLNDRIDVEGTNITLSDTVDNGLVDVVCEGNTLVNLATSENFITQSVAMEGCKFSRITDGFYRYGKLVIPLEKLNLFKSNGEYKVIVNITKNTLVEEGGSQPAFNLSSFNYGGHAIENSTDGNYSVNYNIGEVGIKECVITMKDFANPSFPISTAVMDFQSTYYAVSGELEGYIIICEYNENTQYPTLPFEGMKSAFELEDNNVEIVTQNTPFRFGKGGRI